MSSDHTTAIHVLGDWGTSNLRLYLHQNLLQQNLPDSAQVVAECDGPGIGALTRAPADVLQELLADWNREHGTLDVTLCGMASSRNGLFELPYAEVPADLSSWAQSAQRLQIGTLNVLLATGLKYQNEAGGFDVMRGEETQIFGALQLDPTLRTGNHVVVLPGTHSKWVTLDGGAIRGFRTAITGELFALLSSQSTLLKASAEAGDANDSDAGFVAGSAEGLALRASLLSALFQTRTAQLLQGRSRAWASGYLSGLLIGHEVASLGERALQQVTLIGQSRLAELYGQVFAAKGIRVIVRDGADCARAGLIELRKHWRSVNGEQI